MKITICIPTLNRPEYLYKAIASIYNQEKNDLEFEVCISNNASEKDYSIVESYIEKLKNEYGNINYYQQSVRLPLDQHMHFVVKMSRGDYIYYLGDDDFFLPDAFKNIEILLNNIDVDLAIFNGLIVDKYDRKIEHHLGVSDISYNDFESAFLALRDKGSFGAVMVHKRYLPDILFESLYGSSHAYGCYWLSMLNSKDKSFNIVIPSFECVCLRAAEKNYNFASVYYGDILKEFDLYDKNVLSAESKILNDKVRKRYLDMVYTVKFISFIFRTGAKWCEVKNYRQNGFIFFTKKLIAYFLSFDVIYNPCKKFYSKFNRFNHN